MKERRIMKKKNTDKLTSFLFNILFAMILVVTAIGCSDQAPLEVESESGSSDEATYISVSFGVDTPAFGLPMVTRSTSAGWDENERTYETYTAWVFEQDASSGEYTYRYCVRDDEQIDGEDAISLRPIDGVDNQWTILALLQETSKDTKVVLTANLRESMKGHFPEVGDTYVDAMKSKLSATIAVGSTSASVPYIGECTFSSGIQYGAKKSSIDFECMVSKISLDASEANSEASKFFQINRVKLYNFNQVVRGDGNASTASSDIKNSGWINVNNNTFTCYVAPTDNASNSFIIIDANYDGSQYFYKLKFVKTSEKISMKALTRNVVYSFSLNYVTDTGFTTLKDARNATLASNEVSDGTTVNAFVIDQEDIMDVTTDDSVFLGLTSGSLNIYRDDCNDDYYFTHFSVISNNGWNTISSELNALPGISLSVTSATKSDCTYSDGRYKTFSVWVYLEKDQYTPANYPTNQFEIKVYTGNIQKKIKVNYIDSDRP